MFKFLGLIFTLSLAWFPVSRTTISNLQDNIIIDCNYEFDEIFKGLKIPDKIKNNLILISVEYYSFDEQLHRGQILIHKKLARDVHEIFEIIKNKKFPIGKVIPINRYDWSDDKSMQDNNTSAFNYRYVKGTSKLSSHALGTAIDINPMLNPQIKNGKPYPVKAEYNIKISGTISAESFVVKEFIKRGWKWGGYWRRNKDYQHFEK